MHKIYSSSVYDIPVWGSTSRSTSRSLMVQTGPLHRIRTAYLFAVFQVRRLPSARWMQLSISIPKDFSFVL